VFLPHGLRKILWSPLSGENQVAHRNYSRSLFSGRIAVAQCTNVPEETQP
jgi:hypothetical protein